MVGSAQHEYVATCTNGVEGVLADELAAMPGVRDLRPLRGAVAFVGTLEAGYRVALWSRIASRVLIELGSFGGDDADALYEGVQQIDWREHVDPEGTLAVSFIGTNDHIRNSMFGAMRTKDAICDQIRDNEGVRPSVDLERPDIRVHIHLRRGNFSVALDLAGDPLHERGYHRSAGPAPIKETLAAAILHLAEWPDAARSGAPLVDPMCGCGTFLLEAAGMALDRPAGFDRDRWGFSKWRSHDPDAWAVVRQEAQERMDAARGRQVAIYGADHDPEALRTTKVNAAKANLPVFVKRQDVADSAPPDSPRRQPPYGLVVTNPPYGERLSTKAGAEQLGRRFSRALRERYWGWSVFVIAGSQELARGIGLPATRSKPLWNGPIECRLLQYDIGS